MFKPQYLQGASSELVQSMLKICRTAAQLKQEKLQVEIQKEKSKLRQKRLDGESRWHQVGEQKAAV